MKELEEKSFVSAAPRWDSKPERETWQDERCVKLSDAKAYLEKQQKEIEELSNQLAAWKEWANPQDLKEENESLQKEIEELTEAFITQYANYTDDRDEALAALRAIIEHNKKSIKP